ncbi:TRPM8 channel-associated factor 2 isoform X2 [Ascaphus truei]
MPRSPIYTQHTVDHSADLKHLLQGVSYLDISGRSVPSELLVHGALAFPVGLSDSNQCFLAAAHYGNGRVVVGAHEGHLSSPQLKAFILNAMSWLDQGRNGMIGIHKNLRDLSHVLQKGSVSREVSNLVSGLSVYCCNSYSDHEAEVIQQFVAEGGGLLIAGHAWYWSYQNPDCEVLTHYPGNRILNNFGVSILDRTVPQGNYKVPDPEGAENYYLFRRALCQLQSDLQSGADSKPPLRSWMQKLRQDSCTFLRLQGQDFPLVSSLQKEFVEMVKTYGIPNICQEGPVCGKSKEALFLCLAHEVHSLSLDCELGNDDPYLHDKSSVTVQIDATNPGGEAWRSTGLYLPPGRTATLVFPAWAVGKDLQVQVGCHSDNLSSAEQLCRAPVVVRRWCILGERTLVSCVWGGLLYIIVRAESQLGNVPLIVYGAQQSPTYIQGETCLTSWLETIRHFPSPWAELITENIILTVPSDTIRSLEDPHDLLSLWDKIMIAVTELAMIPPKFPRPERIVTDVQISAGWMHAGYPIMCHLQSVCHLTDLQHMQRVGLWGFIHELGHNEQRKCWEFPPHTTEATCNLWSVYVHETVLGIPRDQAHSELQPKNRDFRILQFLQNGANLQQWHVWTALETYLQLQEGFGWDPLKRLFSEYQTMSDIKDENTYKMNLWVEKFSQAVQRNLAPFFQAWGWPMQGETCSKVSTFPEWEEDPMRSYLRAMTA